MLEELKNVKIKCIKPTNYAYTIDDKPFLMPPYREKIIRTIYLDSESVLKKYFPDIVLDANFIFKDSQ